MTAKNKIIADTVKYLQEKYGHDSIIVKDYWETDNNAIGVVDKNQSLLEYFSVYNADSERMFYLSLEELTPEDEFPYKTLGDIDNLTLVEMENVIALHLNL